MTRGGFTYSVVLTILAGRELGEEQAWRRWLEQTRSR